MRLIDADELKADLRQYFTDGVLDGISARLAFNQILHDIDNAPTVEPKLSDEQIEKITDLLESEWGYEGIREDVSRILRGGK